MFSVLVNILFAVVSLAVVAIKLPFAGVFFGLDAASQTLLNDYMCW